MSQPVRKIKTGWCNSGSHEGTPKTSPGGKKFPECIWRDTCGCECHERLRLMRQIAGLPAPEDPVPSMTPDPDKLAAMGIISIVRGGNGSGNNTDNVVELRPKEFRRTQTGRRAKGQLEHEVCELVLEWMQQPDYKTEQMTPARCAELLDPDDPPSSGAVDSIFKTWMESGFALVAKKPTRIVGITPLGIQLGLVQFKAQRQRRG